MKTIYAGTVSGNGSVKGNGEGVNIILLDDHYKYITHKAYPCENAGIITLSNGYLYAANESRNFDHGFNGSGGGITAFKIEENQLIRLNESLSYGSRPSYISVNDHYLVVSNHGSHSSVVCSYIQTNQGKWELKRGYDDSSIALFALNNDGSIGELLDLHVFKGHGYWVGGGQSTAHLHSVKFHDGLIFACNRGCDEIEVMKIQNNKLIVLNQFKTRKALAPRHLDFHPSKKVFYVCNENYPCVSAYHYDDLGNIQELQTAPTIENFIIPNYTKEQCSKDEINDTVMGGNRNQYMPADIHISKDGQYLYVSNRHFINLGSICVFKVLDNGTLSIKQIFELEGKDPRGFNLIDHDHIIVGLLDNNKVYIYQLEDGIITKLVETISIPGASCFVE